MRSKFLLAAGWLGASLLSSCGGGGSGGGGNSSAPDPATSPLHAAVRQLQAEGVHVNAYEDLYYGSDQAQTFDLILPDGVTPAMPVVVYVHGGGFISGDKASVYTNTATAVFKQYLSQGIAVANINYRLLTTTGVDPDGVRKPLFDIKRAVQFLRYQANTYHLDKTRLALQGSSAGGGGSLWLGLNDDMADPLSADPVLRESTRVRAVAADEAQASYDIVQWQTQIFGPHYPNSDFKAAVLANPALRQRLYSFYGIPDFDSLFATDINAYRAQVDMLALMDNSDAPFWVRNAEQPLINPLTAPSGDQTSVLFHHVYHAKALADKAQAVGLEHVAYLPALGQSDPADASITAAQFLIDHLR